MYRKDILSQAKPSQRRIVSFFAACFREQIVIHKPLSSQNSMFLWR